MFDAHLLQQVVNGLSVGLVYALIAIGFTLIFGVLNVVNFAHGEIYTLGAFAGLLAINAFSPPMWVVLGAALTVGALGGLLLERVAFAPFRRFRDEASLASRAVRESTLISSLAVSIVMKNSMEMAFGGEMQPIPHSYLLDTPVTFAGLAVTTGQLLILGVSMLILVALQYLLYRTKTGLSIRAISQNPMGARYVGLRLDRTILATFGVGSALGGVAGILVGLYYGAITPHMGFKPGIKAFVAMVMGGLSSLPGAVASSLILGVAESVATDFVAAGWSDMIAYSLLVVCLIFFPQGIFGSGRERV